MVHNEIPSETATLTIAALKFYTTDRFYGGFFKDVLLNGMPFTMPIDVNPFDRVRTGCVDNAPTDYIV